MAVEDQLSAITKKVYIPKAVDNIFNSNYVLKRLRGKQKSFDGGTFISQPIEYAELASGGSFAGLELLDTAVNDVITGVNYEWRQYYVTLGWSRADYLKNKGSQVQVINLVSGVTQNASKKMSKLLSTGLFQSTKAASTDIDGLVTAVCAASTTNCGGISSSDFSNWAAQRDTTTTKLSLSALNAAERAASDGPDRTTLWVTTDAILGYYYDIATPLQRYQSTETASQGFTSLTFNGVPFISDKNCPSSYVFGLNEDHLWLAAHPSEDMRYKEPQEPLNQAASLGQIFWMGNLITDSRRRQIVFTGITS